MKTKCAAVFNSLVSVSLSLADDVTLADDCCRLVNRRCEKEVLEVEYHDSLPLSFFLSCGNIMAAEMEVNH